jgi:hypothetical protein
MKTIVTKSNGGRDGLRSEDMTLPDVRPKPFSGGANDIEKANGAHRAVIDDRSAGMIILTP